MRLPIFIFLTLISCFPVFAEEEAFSASPPAQEASSRSAQGMKDAAILGIVEGVTEYLPVSSTGHLIITSHFLGLDDQTPVRDEKGSVIWVREPSNEHPEGQPLTRKFAVDAFSVVIQFGAIAAVAILYWKQIWSMLMGICGKDAKGLRLLTNLIIAFLPAAVIGLLLHDWIENVLFSVPTVIAALLVGAFIMIGAECWRKRRGGGQGPDEVSLQTMTPRQSLLIGCMQVLALWPGMSRSMATIVGGYLVNLSPRQSAEFSFLLGLVTLTAATGYKFLKSGSEMVQVLGVSSMIVGCLVATLTAVIAVRFLVGYLNRHGLLLFAVYRVIIAGVLAYFLFC